jgi:hypothetical protein
MNSTCRQLRLAPAICLIAGWSSLTRADDATSEAAAKYEAGKIIKAKILNLQGTFLGYHNFGGGSETFWQYHSFTWDLHPVTRTLSDTLNGLKWRGRIDSKIDAYRSTSNAGKGSPKSRCWKPWEDIKKSSSQFGWILWLDKKDVWKNELVSTPESVGGDKAPAHAYAERALKLPECQPTLVKDSGA